MGAACPGGVRFGDDVAALVSHGVDTVVEIGPDAVLAGLVDAPIVVATQRRERVKWLTTVPRKSWVI